MLANEPGDEKPEYPRMVIYGGPNGKIWAGPLMDWHRRMEEIL